MRHVAPFGKNKATRRDPCFSTSRTRLFPRPSNPNRNPRQACMIAALQWWLTGTYIDHRRISNHVQNVQAVALVLNVCIVHTPFRLHAQVWLETPHHSLRSTLRYENRLDKKWTKNACHTHKKTIRIITGYEGLDTKLRRGMCFCTKCASKMGVSGHEISF